jgi:hypothetical protein
MGMALASRGDFVETSGKTKNWQVSALFDRHSVPVVWLDRRRHGDDRM